MGRLTALQAICILSCLQWAASSATEVLGQKQPDYVAKRDNAELTSRSFFPLNFSGREKSSICYIVSCGNIKCSMITLHPLRFQSVMTRLRKQRSNDRAASKLLKTETFYVASEFYNQSGGTNALTDKCHACNSLTERIYYVDQLGNQWEVFSGWLQI